jgi:hypothetical protein
MNRFKRLLIIASLLGLVGCVACEAPGPAIARALALTPLQRAQIAADLRDLAAAHPADIQEFKRGVDIPKEFALLDPVSVVADPVFSRINLAGCGEDKVLVMVQELGDTKAQLVLLKGEREGVTVLWSNYSAPGK